MNLRNLCLTLLMVSASGLTATGQPATLPVAVQEYRTSTDVAYRPELAAGDAYAAEMCRLDLYAPDNATGFATVVWFHGGGLRSGQKSIPDALKNQGIAVVAADYRLFPKVKAPVYIEDAAAAVAWTFDHIEDHGGDPDAIYVSGHSAGGYLTSMIGLDKSWLAAHDLDADRIAGLIPYSGHAITHFTVREERGIPGNQPVVDGLAPLYHVRPDAPPLVLITGDREKEMLGRYEETAYLWRMMRVAGHKHTELHELKGFNHGGMATPAHAVLLDFVKSHHANAQPDTPSAPPPAAGP